VGGVGLAGAAGLGTLVFRAAPRLWKQLSRDVGRVVAPPPLRPRPERWPDRGLYAAWLGHSTVLLKIDGFTILTDPVFSSRIGINLGIGTLGPKRFVGPALAAGQLPKVDLILLSHAHMDHFDLPSLRRLESRRSTVVTAANTSDLLRVDRYGGVRELRWGQKTAAGPLEIRAFRVNHWGARMRSDTHRGYNGYALESGRYRVLFGGDTADTGLFADVRSAKPYHLAIMPVGAYNPWIHYHCTPEQAWRMAGEANSEFFLPVHHQTFPLSDEPPSEPIERVLTAAGNHPDRVAARRIGEEFSLTL
jgi:L-ascorbate metabolism protein UlaG (beta-lactamase superfamily)